MSERTNIEWCDSTVNPTTGCDGCELWKQLGRGAPPQTWGGPCYAGNFHEQRLAKSLPKLYAPRFTDVRLMPGRMAKAAAWSNLAGTGRPDKPWLNGLPRTIFVGDMGDLFSKDIPFEYIRDEVFGAATSLKGSRHVWMLLTKQPSRMAKFADWLGEWPKNVWPGASVTTQKTVQRVDYLKRVPSNNRYLSVEPMLEPIDLSEHLFCERCRDESTQCGRGAYLTPLDNASGGCWFRECGCSPVRLVIVGGESRQKHHFPRPCELSAVRALRDQCHDAGVSYFLKQLGSAPAVTVEEWQGWPDLQRVHSLLPGETKARAALKDHHGGDPSEWPEDLRGCRAFPRVRALEAAR